MQETFSAPDQAQPGMDGFERSFANLNRASEGIAPNGLMTGPDAAAPACIVFLDDLRLTRDCLVEILQDHCPDMIILGFRPMDYAPETMVANVAIIVYNLHDGVISEAIALLRMEARGVAAPPVLFIANRAQRSEIVEAMECGAMGLIRSDVRIDLLIAAIRLVMAGGSYFPADTLTTLMAQTPAAKPFP